MKITGYACCQVIPKYLVLPSCFLFLGTTPFPLFIKHAGSLPHCEGDGSCAHQKQGTFSALVEYRNYKIFMNKIFYLT